MYVPQPRPDACELSDREWQVVALVARGWTNTQIAEELVLGQNTIKTHVSRILKRLELSDRTELVALLYRRGWLVADLAQEGDAVTVPRPLFDALNRLVAYAQHGRFPEAQALAKNLALYLPSPKTQAPPRTAARRVPTSTGRRPTSPAAARSVPAAGRPPAAP